MFFKFFLILIFFNLFNLYADNVDCKLYFLKQENEELKNKIALLKTETDSKPVKFKNDIVKNNEEKDQDENNKNNFYLALLNHIYYNINDSTSSDTFRTMFTYIMGNDFYLTLTPSFSFNLVYNSNVGANPHLNDAVITLSYGSPGGANPASSLYSTGQINAALSFTLPFSSYSRNSSLITAGSLAVNYVNVFNNRRTSLSIGPSIGYNFRTNTTSAPTVTDTANFTNENSFDYMGNLYEKLIPYSEMSVGAGVNVVQTVMTMTYLIAWASLDAIHFYDDYIISSGQVLVITPSQWTTSASLGGKIFFPISGFWWGDFAVSSFIPFNADASHTITIGLSYFF